MKHDLFMIRTLLVPSTRQQELVIECRDIICLTSNNLKHDYIVRVNSPYNAVGTKGVTV